MNKALLAVSFGTSHRETRASSIEAIERDLRASFPHRRFYRAWTSGFIRKKLKDEEGLSIDSPREALERMLSDGITDALVQPTHIMNGGESAKITETIRLFEGRFERLTTGSPLLDGRADLRELARALERVFSYVGYDEMLGLMGHGSSFADPDPYELLNEDLKADGYENFCVGTVEHAPGFEPVLLRARELQPAKIYLAPLLVVAGEHALRDMAGDEPSSWESRLRSEGFRTVSILRGLGEFAPIREIYVSHARRAERKYHEG